MLTFQSEGAQFNVRVAGVAIAADCVLLHQMAGDDFWTLPGGRPGVMETAAAALRREMLEETGLKVHVRRAMCVVENFFTYRTMSYHEILMCFEMDVPPASVLAGQRFDGVEGAVNLTFWWCPLVRLEEVPIRPTFLCDVLRAAPGALVHIVHDDRGNLAT